MGEGQVETEGDRWRGKQMEEEEKGGGWTGGGGDGRRKRQMEGGGHQKVEEGDKWSGAGSSLHSSNTSITDRFGLFKQNSSSVISEAAQQKGGELHHHVQWTLLHLTPPTVCLRQASITATVHFCPNTTIIRTVRHKDTDRSHITTCL